VDVLHGNTRWDKTGTTPVPGGTHGHS
jgi:hypothetical protein